MFSINYWARPEAFWLGLIIPIYLIWYVRVYRSNRLRLFVTHTSENEAHLSAIERLVIFLPSVLTLCAILMCIMSLARPQFVSRWENMAARGSDIIWVLDISASMQEEEERLTKMRAAMLNCVESSVPDRMGIILFGEEAFTYLPLTWDKRAASDMIRRIQPGLVPAEGSSIGNALALAIHRLEMADAQAPVIVLLSDGRNNTGYVAPLSIASLAAQKGIPIFSVLQSPQEKGKLKASDSLAWLQVGLATRGKTHFVSNFEQANLNAFLQTPEVIRGGRTPVYRVAEDRYPYFLAFAIVCLVASIALRSSSWTNPLEV